MSVSAMQSSAWYRSLNAGQWKALIASNLGWTFDGFEVFALILTVGAALHQLLPAAEYPRIPAYERVKELGCVGASGMIHFATAR